MTGKSLMGESPVIMVPPPLPRAGIIKVIKIIYKMIVNVGISGEKKNETRQG